MADMNSTIKTLILIDKNAREKVSNAKDEAQNIVEEANQERLRLQAEYDADARKRINEVRAAYADESKEKSTGLKVKRKVVLARLSSAMENNRDQWEEEIVGRITSV